MIPHISSFKDLTPEDEKTLEGMRGSEVFHLMCKILAKEWRIATTKMLACPREDLEVYQGFSQAIMSVYNNLMRYSNVDLEVKSEDPLLGSKKLRNIKK